MARPGTIDTLRYLKRDRLRSEQQIVRNYFRELIHAYGVDAVYFRRDDDPFNAPSGTNFDYTYGEQPASTYWLSSNVIVYIASQTDAFLNTRFGLESNQHEVVYILIDDYTESFRDLVGSPLLSSFVVDLEGECVGGSAYVRGDVVDDEGDLSGYVSSYFELSTSGYASGEVSLPFIRYPRKFSDLVYKSQSYTDRVVVGELSGTWSGTLDASLNGTLTGSVSGELSYFSSMNAPDSGPHWKIAPKVGDFFRLDFNDDNHEEYEIADVSDRDLHTNGPNQLLTKYVWKMECNRRDPSHEDVVGTGMTFRKNLLQTGGRAQEEFTPDMTNQNYIDKLVSQDLFNYEETPVDNVDLENSDDVYGSYNLDDNII